MKPRRVPQEAHSTVAIALHPDSDTLTTARSQGSSASGRDEASSPNRHTGCEDRVSARSESPARRRGRFAPETTCSSAFSLTVGRVHDHLQRAKRRRASGATLANVTGRLRSNGAHDSPCLYRRSPSGLWASHALRHSRLRHEVGGQTQAAADHEGSEDGGELSGSRPFSSLGHVEDHYPAVRARATGSSGDGDVSIGGRVSTCRAAPGPSVGLHRWKVLDSVTAPIPTAVTVGANRQPKPGERQRSGPVPGGLPRLRSIGGLPHPATVMPDAGCGAGKRRRAQMILRAISAKMTTTGTHAATAAQKPAPACPPCAACPGSGIRLLIAVTFWSRPRYRCRGTCRPSSSPSSACT